MNERTNGYSFPGDWRRLLPELTGKHCKNFGHVVYGWISLECIGLQMFNYLLTYLPTLKMRF